MHLGCLWYESGQTSGFVLLLIFPAFDVTDRLNIVWKVTVVCSRGETPPSCTYPTTEVVLMQSAEMSLARTGALTHMHVHTHTKRPV